MLIAPTEPRKLRETGRSSSLPERYGVDILWVSPMGKVGVQRKALPDFLASVADGRLAREYPMMAPLDVKVLLIEGDHWWSDQGYLQGHGLSSHGKPWTRRQFRSYLHSVRLKGVWVDFTETLDDTIDWLADFKEWTWKEQHRSLDVRPNPKDAWGQASSRDWGIHILQGFPGIGVGVAGDIFDHYGRVPLRWDVSKADLLEIKGIGPKRADQMWEALQ